MKEIMQLSIMEIWNLKEKKLLDLLESVERKQRGKEVRFYMPSFTYYKNRYYNSSTTTFPTISITGNDCSLNCKHCGGKVLETMHPAFSPEELFQLGVRMKQNGASGCLISGGCLPDGTVPLNRYVTIFGRLKQEIGLSMFVHTGIIKPETAYALKDVGIDLALIDIIGSNETTRKIFNLKVRVEDYSNSLKALKEAGINFVPHVIVGLNEGKLDGELQALQMIQQVNPVALVIIAFMPIHGTSMAKTPPAKSVDIAKVALMARLMIPQIPLVLGCMRPKGKTRSETDILALKAGVDAIAFPSEKTIEYAKNKGYKIAFSSYCCAQIYADAIKNN